ncbi:MAG: glycosyltransferase [Clostridia bacterium]|nr:glycosyltransferase [Clostridia bacterium]
MKVLQIAFDTMHIGGVQKDIIDMAENIPECHFDVVVIKKEIGHLEKRFIELGGTIFRITEYEGNNPIRKMLEYFIKKFRLFIKTYQILKKYGPYDAIHSHNQFRSGFTNAAAFFAGVKVRIAHSHNDQPPQKNNAFKKLLFHFYRILILVFSNVRMACSEGAAKYLFYQSERAEIILNGTDMKKFNIEKYPYHSNGKSNYIHIGRFTGQKNQLFLLDVFSAILKVQPNSQLKMVGFGSDEKKIRDRINDNQLTGKVEILPPDSDVPALLSESEFMIFPSVYEGFPNVQIEAQVMGVECFVSDTVTKESDLGLSTYISLHKSPEEWAFIITEKVKNHDFTERLKVDIHQKSRVDASIICRRYLAVYQGKNCEKHAEV